MKLYNLSYFSTLVDMFWACKTKVLTKNTNPWSHNGLHHKQKIIISEKGEIPIILHQLLCRNSQYTESRFTYFINMLIVIA